LNVITAFHFLEHCPFGTVFRLVKETVRVLRPGGFLVLEVPNAANLLMGSHDPTLLEFLLEFHGLNIIHRLPMNAPPEEEQLPFRELEFVARLNSHLYGSRDYGLIARR
jgi:O-antigen chain-terminating methyltransferase